MLTRLTFSTTEATKTPGGIMQAVTTTAPADAASVATTCEREHLVITLHGIRTFGRWQERLGQLLHRRDPNLVTYHYKYGYFPLLKFLAPPLRWWAVRSFRRWLLQTLAQHPHARRVDLVAHSFGTYLAAWAIHGLPPQKRPRLHTIILAGSVLPNDFPWGELLHEGTVQRVVNECALKDWVLVANSLLVPFTGMAGWTGFVGGLSERFQNRYYPFGHSGFYERRGHASYVQFMQARWLPLLLGEGHVPPFDCRTDGYINSWWRVVWGDVMPFVKLAFWCALWLCLGWQTVCLASGRIGARARAEVRAEARTEVDQLTRQVAARAEEAEKRRCEADLHQHDAECRAASAEALYAEVETQRRQAVRKLRQTRLAFDRVVAPLARQPFNGPPEVDAVRRDVLEQALAFYEDCLREAGETAPALAGTRTPRLPVRLTTAISTAD